VAAGVVALHSARRSCTPSGTCCWRAHDTEAATAVALALCVAVFAVPALVLWDVDASAWPYIAGSAAFELGYVATLAGALARGDLSIVYALARIPELGLFGVDPWDLRRDCLCVGAFGVVLAGD